MFRTVAEIMERKLVTVPADATVRHAVHLLTEEGISGAPVVEEGGRTVGVVSASDVLQLASRDAEIPAGARPARAAPPDDPVGEPPPGFFTSEEPAGDLLDGLEIPESIFDDYSVADIMTPAAFSVTPDTSIADLADFLLRGRIHRALVMEGEELRGIVTSFDVLRTLAGAPGTEPTAGEEPGDA